MRIKDIQNIARTMKLKPGKIIWCRTLDTGHIKVNLEKTYKIDQ